MLIVYIQRQGNKVLYAIKVIVLVCDLPFTFVSLKNNTAIVNIVTINICRVYNAVLLHSYFFLILFC